MGKRRKSSARDAAAGSTANKELERLLLQILDTTTRIPDAKEEWDQYLTVHSLVESVRRLEQGIQHPCFPAAGDRSASLDQFVRWLTANGVDMHKVCLDDYGPLGLGLKASAELKAAEQFLSIPRRIMMLSDVRDESPLSIFIRSDPIASKMPNVALALQVLHERTAAESFWTPYLDVLPASYSTPLYFSPEDLEQLRGSPCLSECIGLYRSIARQYAYFYRLLAPDCEAATQNSSQQQTGLPLLGRFTYDGYRWAVSTVMTRQNCVPRGLHGAVSGDCSALIPLWDMCNHAPGEMSTDYSTDSDCCQSYVCTDVSAGQQIFICYGYRSNREFFLHSGFVSPDNPYDRLLIKLGLSKNDPLFVQRSSLLEKVGLSSSQSYELQNGKQPVTAPLLAFLRIFNASSDELKTLSASDNEVLISLLTDSSLHVSGSNSAKSWSFLAGRVDLLLRAYQGSPPQSDQMHGAALSPNADLVRSLVAEEKKILQCTLSYCRSQAETLQSSAVCCSGAGRE